MRDIDWVRTQWREAKWVAQSLGSTAVAGHSFGALLAADLAALFIAASVQSLTQVPVDLRKPTPPLTDAPQALAIQHLTSIDRIAQARGCRVDLKWRVGDVEGARTLGP